MTSCDKTTSVNELPQCTDVPSDSYLIVQGEGTTCKVKIKDLVLGAENLDFYPELTEILNKLDTLTSIVQTNSAKWSGTHTSVLTGQPIWESIADLNLQGTKDIIDQKSPEWNSASSLVANNSANWEASTDTVTLSADQWNLTHDKVVLGEESWNTAYVGFTDGAQSIHEALEMIAESPWFTLYTGSSAQSVYTTVNTNSAAWML